MPRSRRRAVSSLIGTFMLLLVAISIFSAMMVVQTSSLGVFEKVSRSIAGSGRVPGNLEAVSVYVNASGLVVEARNPGPRDVVLVFYYVRDTTAGNVTTGRLLVRIPVGSTEDVLIPGSFSTAGSYVVVFVDTEGDSYRFTYPYTSAAGGPPWEFRLLDVPWNPLEPRGAVVSAYSVDYRAFYPSSATVRVGSYVSGTLPNDVQASDNVYYIVASAASGSISKTYYPDTINVLTGSLEAGTALDLRSNDNIYYVTIRALPTVFSISGYMWAEQVTVGAQTYYKIKIQAPNTPTTISGSTTATSSGTYCLPVGQWVYPIQPYRGTQIPASTWTVYYHAWYSATTSGLAWVLGAYAYLDISVLHTDGTTTAIAQNFAQTAIDTNSGTIKIGSDNFPGYTVGTTDDYLLIDYYVCADIAIWLGSVDLTLAATINETESRIDAQNVWARTYSVEAEFVGTSNTAYDWLQIDWGADIRVDASGAAGFMALYNYPAAAYRTTAPGYLDIPAAPTVDTIYSDTILDAQYPEDYRDSATGEFRIKIRLDRNVSWNEGFNLYIDYMYFTPTYVNMYTADTAFTVTGLETQNIASLNVTFDANHNLTVSTFNIYLYNYATNAWDLKYTAGPGARFSGSVVVNVGAPSYVNSLGEALIRVESIYTSDSAAPFQQETDLLMLVEGIYGAPSLVIGTSGFDYVTVYRYFSNQTQRLALPKPLGPGMALASSGNIVYVVYGDGTTSFDAVDPAAGTVTALAALPSASVDSLLVFDPGSSRVYYLDNLTGNNVFNIYDPATDTWVGTLAFPASPPIYACTFTPTAMACINATHLVLYDTALGTASAYMLPIFVEPIGILYDGGRDLLYIVFRTGDIYTFPGTWVKMDPLLPPSDVYSLVVAQDPDRLYYLRAPTRELYIVGKNSIVPSG